MSKKRILVTGASGFVGGHLVNYLREKENCFIQGIDIKEPEFRIPSWDKFEKIDLRYERVIFDFDEVYALAADMGGMAYISTHNADILYNNLLINLNSIQAAKRCRVRRYFYSSSACIYPGYLQDNPTIQGLAESDAYPAMPEDAYGWEKLITERLCEYYALDYGMTTRVARFHNIFGPYGTWTGGREKAPAAICRKVSEAKLKGLDSIEIWGDGEQTRSFCYIDDCVEGIYTIMQNSGYGCPFNLGQDRMVSINQLADIVMDIAGVQLEKKYVKGPQGVRGRNSDNSFIEKTLGWKYKVSLEDGLERTYKWIESQVLDKIVYDDLMSPKSAGND